MLFYVTLWRMTFFKYVGTVLPTEGTSLHLFRLTSRPPRENKLGVWSRKLMTPFQYNLASKTEKGANSRILILVGRMSKCYFLLIDTFFIQLIISTSIWTFSLRSCYFLPFRFKCLTLSVLSVFGNKRLSVSVFKVFLIVLEIWVFCFQGSSKDESFGSLVSSEPSVISSFCYFVRFFLLLNGLSDSICFMWLTELELKKFILQVLQNDRMMRQLINVSQTIKPQCGLFV